MPKSLLTVVIPTWNRRRLVEVAIDSICSQVGDLPVEVFVSDHGSTDGTFPMLLEKQKEWKCLKPFICKRAEVSDFTHNFKFAFCLPDSAWTWTFGDDDIMLPHALQKVLAILDERVPFIHVGEIARTENTMQVIEGRMIDICNDHGLLDFTGFITGNIVRSDKLQAGMNSANWDVYAGCAFPQSLALLEALFYDNVALIDFALVEPQDRDLSGPLRTEDDRGGRWAMQNIGARYSYLIPMIRILLETVGYKEPLKASFFRYLSYYLWDRFIGDTINSYCGALINNPDMVFEHHFLWDLFAEMADYLNKDEGQALKDELERGKAVVDKHMKAVAAMNLIGVEMDDYLKHHQREHFPYNYLGEIGARHKD